MRFDLKSPALAFAPILVLGPALTCAVPRVMASLYIISALIFFVIDWRFRGNKPQFDRTLVAIFFGFATYGLASYFWSISPSAAFEKVGQFALIWIPLLALVPGLRRLNTDDIALIGKLLLSGLGLGLAMFTFENLTDFTFYEMLRGGNSGDFSDVKQNKPAALLVMWFLMCLPWLLAKDIRRLGFLALALAGTIYAISQAKSASTGIILALSPMLLGIIALINTRIVLKLAFGAMVIITILMPIAARHLYTDTPWLQSPLSNSFKARIEIWDQAARRSFERPILGWGLDSSPDLPNRGEWSQLQTIENGEILETPIAHLHPHNAPIQIWFELGALGIAFVLALIAVMYRRIVSMTGASQRHAIFMASVLFLYTLSIWGIWQTWFLATLCLFGLMAQAGARHLESKLPVS